MTTNCIIEPRAAYKDRIFTTGEVRRLGGGAGQGGTSGRAGRWPGGRGVGRPQGTAI